MTADSMSWGLGGWIIGKAETSHSALQTLIPSGVRLLIQKKDVAVSKLYNVRHTDEESRWFGDCTLYIRMIFIFFCTEDLRLET